MIEKFQLKGCICKADSGIPLNWRDMRSKFEYKLLGDILLCDFFKTKEVTIKW